MLAEDFDLPTGFARCRACDIAFHTRRRPPRNPTSLPLQIRETSDGRSQSFTVNWYEPRALALGVVCLVSDAGLTHWLSGLVTHPSLQLLATIPAVLVAGVVTYYALSMWINTTTIEVRRKELTVRHGPLPGWPGARLPTREIRQLQVLEHPGRLDRYQLVALCGALATPITTRHRGVAIARYLEWRLEEVMFLDDRKGEAE